MKQMTKLENIIMNRSVCNRETANLIANDILQEVEKDLQVEIAREIFTEIEFDIHNLDFDREETRATAIEGVIAILKKIYTGGEPNGN